MNSNPSGGDGQLGRSSNGEPGVVRGRPLAWLRLEATATTAAALALFAAPLPGAVGIAEVDGHAGRQAEPGVLGDLFALVPGEGPAQLLRQRGRWVR